MVRAVFTCAALSLLFIVVLTITEAAKCCDESKCRNNNNLSAAAATNEYECQAPLLLSHNNATSVTSSSLTTGTATVDALNCSDGYVGYPIQNETTAYEEEGTQYYTCCLPEEEASSASSIIELVLGFLAFGFLLVLLLGILRSKEVRRHPFNLYLIFLYIPSLIYVATVIAIVICQLFTCHDTGTVPTLWSFGFYASSNLSLNAVIAHDVYRLLRNSKKCLRIRPLPLKTLYTRVAVVYTLAILYGTWSAFLISGKIESLPNNSYAGWVADMVTKAVFLLGPTFYVLYICIRVGKDKLLPLHGETRALAFFFLRIVIVSVVICIPFYIVWAVSYYYIDRPGFADVLLAFNILAIGGEIVCEGLALTKPDVRRSVKQLLCCGNEHWQWNAQRRKQPSSGKPSEQMNRNESLSAAEGRNRRIAKNDMRVSAWETPDDYGDNIVRERYLNRPNNQADIGSVDDEERS